MCVILYCPPGRKIKEEFLLNAFNNNHDGAGVMWFDKDGEVHFKKGFMEYPALKEFWKGLDENLPRAVHCRLATCGEISPATCHPFVITDDLQKMETLEGTTDTGVLMHNGILDGFEPPKRLSQYSDTMMFNLVVVYPLVQGGCIENNGVIRMLEDYGSKFLMFLPGFRVVAVGDWRRDNDGFYYSNTTYSYSTAFLDITFD